MKYIWNTHGACARYMEHNILHILILSIYGTYMSSVSWNYKNFIIQNTANVVSSYGYTRIRYGYPSIHLWISMNAFLDIYECING